jgi:hypothetical protein
MAASAGVVGEHDDAFKKASKDVGITFQKARAEASRRKAEMEGRDTPVPKVVTPAPKKVVTPAPAPAPLPKSTPISMPTPEIPSDEDILAATAEYDDVERERMKKECESYGWEPRMFNGIARWLDPSSGDVYSYDAISTIGIYDSENNEFFPTE